MKLFYDHSCWIYLGSFTSVQCCMSQRSLNVSLRQIFPRGELNFTSEAICNWVFEHHEHVLRWLQPPGTKSRLLERELNKGPALLLFLPFDPLGSGSNPVLQQVSRPTSPDVPFSSLQGLHPDDEHHLMCLIFQVGDIAVRYHSCENDGSSLDGGGASGSSCCQSVQLPEARGSVCEVCVISSRPVLTSFSSCPTLSFVDGDGDAVQSHLRRCCLQRERAPLLGCSHFRSSYSPFSRFSACCRRASPPHNQSQAKEVPGRRSPAPTPSTSTGDDITGLRCQTNRTLRFYVLDVALNWPLAVRLGAGGGGRNASLTHQGGDSEGSPFAAIVDLKDEVHYVLQRSPLSTLTESLGKDDQP